MKICHFSGGRSEFVALQGEIENGTEEDRSYLGGLVAEPLDAPARETSTESMKALTESMNALESESMKALNHCLH
jgi:hypothetical protein